ncbi:MAG: transcription-repair coupling factor [Firmicutes bacterium]|nr:transcription-repair coupling factor [Bacillota bacterium]
MESTALLSLLAGSREWRWIYNGHKMSGERSGCWLHGFTAAHKAIFLAGLYRQGWPQPGKQRPMVVIAAGPHQAERLREDLAALLPEDEVLLFPSREIWPHEEVPVPHEVTAARLAVLLRLVQDRPAVIVAPVQAAVEKLPPRERLSGAVVSLSPGQRMPIESLTARLVANGYERVDMVEGPGQFSVRGSLVDIVPGAAGHRAVRIDFFDDEIDSIRWLDVETQRSSGSSPRVAIGPAWECPAAGDEAVTEAIARAAERQAERLRRVGRNEAAEELIRRVAEHLESLRTGRRFAGIEQYAPFFFDRLDTLLDYAAGGAAVLDEPARTREQLHLFSEDFAHSHTAQLERGRVLPEEAALFADWDELLAAVRRRPALFVAGLEQHVPGLDDVPKLEVSSRLPEMFHGKLEPFVREVRERRRSGWRVVIAAATSERAERIENVLKDEEIPVKRLDGEMGPLSPGTVTIAVMPLSAGCELPAARTLVLTELEIFGQRKHRRASRPGGGPAARLDDLRVGDLVVHVNHGIGRYMGVETLEIAGAHKDYLVVQYAGDDKLYVPTDQVQLLQKYIGVEGQVPRLNRLGGNEWARVKSRVKESVRELAQGLLKLYAEREALPGYAFSKDTVWQQQFEEAFPYEETPDQLRAIQEVKADMERPRPMDRLLCGDVGFGKTEVAMRAAFKAVMDAKQVAVLVPTTILAQQHLRTFRERFQAYPVRIEALSRFQSPAEQARVLKGLENGSVDIVIGTHRLFSKDVRFKDLGCVIVDEEQRFGVAQKERLKELRRSVDVLTLSATPIPRTLHMALVGLRDMSLIETPPEDRFPVRTYVTEYNEDLVREAIMRELGRGGQVYFVHNRVQDIERFAARLSELVPEARIAIAHGQMDEDVLERVMLEFLNGEIDVLLCSTIIETGMDIANVNTLIVDEADRMGLAQLYQLRGRVGRSNRVAYAYFTYRRDKILTEDAEKRLQAIREFTELGSGFKIAMRDLEIRGAGNLLGPEQHGFIASVGFELYCKLLEEAVREVKGDVVQEPPDPVIDLNVDAYVSDDYVPDPQRKVEVYKKVVAIRRPADVADLEEELEDRFGPAPLPVRNLLAVARVKVLAKELGVASVSGDNGEVAIRLLPGLVLPRESALHLTRKFRGRVLLSPARTAVVKLRCRGLGERDLLMLLEEVLREMKAAWPTSEKPDPADQARVRAVQGARP